jgi:hypothetical protein
MTLQRKVNDVIMSHILPSPKGMGRERGFLPACASTVMFMEGVEQPKTALALPETADTNGRAEGDGVVLAD